MLDKIFDILNDKINELVFELKDVDVRDVEMTDFNYSTGELEFGITVRGADGDTLYFEIIYNAKTDKYTMEEV